MSNSAISNCWTSNPSFTSSTTSSGPFRWNVGSSTTSSNTGASSARSGTKFFYTEASGSNTGDTADLITPEFYLSSSLNYEIEFYYHMYGSTMGKLFIDIFSGGIWHNNVDSIIGQQQTSGTAAWIAKTVNLSSYSGGVYIRFRGIRGTDFKSDICIDDITVKYASSCSAPTNQTVSSLTTSGANLAWTDASGSHWDVYVTSSGSTAPSQSTTPTANDITSNSYTYTGGSAATSYDWYVRSDCGQNNTSTSAWVGPNTFTTTCGVYTPAYNQDFTSYVPTCWTEAEGLLETNTSLSGTSSSWSADGFGNNGTTGSAKINIYGTSRNEWLISPSIDLSGGNYQLEFDIALTEYGNTNSTTLGSDDSLAIIISTDNGTTWSKTNILQTFTSANTITTSGDHIIIDLSSFSNGIYYLRIETLNSVKFKKII